MSKDKITKNKKKAPGDKSNSKALSEYQASKKGSIITLLETKDLKKKYKKSPHLMWAFFMSLKYNFNLLA